MLTEFEGLSQEPTGFRRLLTDKYFDLYLWYEREGGLMSGFQLCYDLGNDPHSLTVRVGGSSSHTRIDDGERGGGHYKASPILVSDGVFAKDEVLKRFDESSRHIDPDLRKLVREAIIRYKD